MSNVLVKLPLLSSKRLEALQSASIYTADDLLHFFPRRYLDRSNVQRIQHLAGSGEEVTVSGHVVSIDEVGFGKRNGWKYR